LLVNHWFDRPTDRAGFRLLAATADGPLVLTRNVQVGPPSDLLQISVSRPEESPPSRIEVRADGRMAAELEVPPTQFGRQTKPLEVSLADFHGQRLRLEIAQRGAAPQALVEWQQIELGARNRP
jgi:hypothetical protein